MSLIKFKSQVFCNVGKYQVYLPILILQELLKSAGAVHDTVPSGLTSMLVSANRSRARILLSTLRKIKQGPSAVYLS